MRPTPDQIQYAAYDRWQRRGCTHGRDREDWQAAEKELLFLLNYQIIAEYPLKSSSPLVLGKADPRRCRFCERSIEQVAFGPPRAVWAGISGTLTLLSAEICDNCQEEWKIPLDNELRSFWESLYAKCDGTNSHVPSGARPIFTVPVFKALIASALLLLPEAELTSVVDAIEWVSNPDHDSDDRLFAEAICQVYSAPFLSNGSWTSLAQRTDDDAPLPNLVLFLAHDGIIIQVPVPLCLQDQDLDGRAVYQPERALNGGFGPDFQESRVTVMPLVLSSRYPRPKQRHPSIAT